MIPARRSQMNSVTAILLIGSSGLFIILALLSSPDVETVGANKPPTPSLSFDPQEEGNGSSGNGFSYCDVSRVLGYASAVALISLFISGCRSPKVKKCLNGLCGCAKNRLRLHRGVSYFALFTALLHGVIFMWKRDTLYLDDLPVLLGDISLVAMALVAVNGIFQKSIVKRYGFRKWHLFHVVGSVVALVTAVLHILKLNTIL